MGDKARAPASLDPLAADVLDELCQARSTRSAVALAVTLWNRGRFVDDLDGDPSGLVVDTVARLCDDGLVVYHLGHYGIPTDIRVTPAGFDLAGYPERVAIGSRAADHLPIRPGDATDFRGLSEHAVGGPIERMPLVDHLVAYAEHAWRHQPEGETQMPRGPNVPLDTRQDIIAMMPQETIGEAAARTGIAFDTVARIRRRDGDPETRSLREAILAEAEAHGPMDDRQLLSLLGAHPRHAGIDLHSLHHQLHSMQRLGLISMHRRQRGRSVDLLRIEPKAQLRTNGGAQALARPATREAEAVAEALEQDFPDNPAQAELDARTDAPIDPMAGFSPAGRAAFAFPVLDGLRARQADRAERLRRAETLLEAAQLLTDVDQAEADRLAARANAVAEEVTLSPVEDEYLRYAAERDGAM